MTQHASIARLPISREYGKRLANIDLDAVAWTLPEAMWVDSFRQCWLHPRFPARVDSGRQHTMRVERRSDGYHVWMPPAQKWQCQTDPSYAGKTDLQYIPVVVLHDMVEGEQ